MNNKDKAEEQIGPFVSAQLGSVIVRILLVIAILFGIGSLMSDVRLYDLGSKIITGKRLTQTEQWQAETLDRDMAYLAQTQKGLYFITGVLFLFWIYCVHGNLPALGARHLRFTSGWAVGWFLIPFMNLIRPYQVVQEIWKASNPFYTDDHSWKTTRSSPLIRWWWILFLMSIIPGNFATKVMSFEETQEVILGMLWVKIGSDGLYFLSAILAFRVVGSINARQKEKSKRFA